MKKGVKKKLISVIIKKNITSVKCRDESVVRAVCQNVKTWLL
jgi:hypothetical protein